MLLFFQIHSTVKAGILNPMPLHLLQAVKLESARAGRTRYLVVVSRFVKNRLQQTLSLPDCQQHHLSKMQSQMVVRSATSGSVNRRVTASCPCTRQCHRQSNSGQVDDKSDVRTKCCGGDGQQDSSRDGKCDKVTCSECTNDDCESDCCGSAKLCGRNYDEEESCLLGIDCNEKSTVGLVLRILADTSIRLDGDG